MVIFMDSIINIVVSIIIEFFYPTFFTNLFLQGQKTIKKRSLNIIRILKLQCLEATPRFELGIKVLQTSALPLGYVAIKWSGKRDSNSRPPPWQGGALPLSYFRITMVPQDRIELSTHGFSVRCSTD